MRRRVALGVVLLAVAALARDGEAHKGITSRFTYNKDVYPVFLNRCGRCHTDGGVGPMSLLKYEDAFPWAEALRAELMSATTGDPHDFVKAAHRQISGRELDIILDWAGGGTPQGDPAATPAAAPPPVDWPSGRPDLVVQMVHRYHMNMTELEATHESAIPVPAASPLTIGRVDVLPGNAAILRSAVLSLRSSDGTTRLLGTWVPRQVPAAIALKPPVRVDPGSEILARMQYKKTWKHEGQAMSDLSVIGLYLAD